jgi:phenylacetate-CoA ligase
MISDSIFTLKKPSIVDIETQQLQLLKRQITYCYRHVPWYRQTLDALKLRPEDFTKLTDIQHLPIISKSQVRQDKSLFISDQYDPKHCHTSFSSGSTGEPFASHFDSLSWYRKRFLNKLLARAACGMKPGQRTAILDVDDRATMIKKNRLARYARPLQQVRVLSIFGDTAALVAELQHFRPANIYGYPSHLVQLASYLRQADVTVTGIRQIFTSSEFLSASTRSYVEATLGAPIYDIYGSTEFKEVAWQCPERGGYHVNAKEVMCEIIEQGQPQTAGKIGDIVLTDLRNRALPLLRFHIGDRGQKIAGPCPCGRSLPMIAPANGRNSDFLTLPGDRQLSGYLLTTAVEKFTDLVRYQFVQADARRLVVNSVWDNPPCTETLEQLQREVCEVTDNTLCVEVQVLPEIPVENSRKHKVIINQNLHH